MAEEQQLLFEDIFGLNILVLPVNWKSSMSSSYFSRISSKLINFTEDEYIKGFAAAFEIKLVEKFWKIVLTSKYNPSQLKKKIFCRKILALLKDISDTDAYDHISTKWHFIYKCRNHWILWNACWKVDWCQWNGVLILTKNSNMKRKLHHLSNF